ncbi:hypothetical protein ANCCEY_01077 [Ancylostoma ceylanicum]|uniref:Uncharacterized protein n=1 Tax=Ancylostoma ceylanicum TaxID=53326 RepID=A0A0D6MAY4_9BILA|nr:hypothetical protein ANCCEY_01077 [Ancylostoma ceylanicum]
MSNKHLGEHLNEESISNKSKIVYPQNENATQRVTIVEHVCTTAKRHSVTVTLASQDPHARLLTKTSVTTSHVTGWRTAKTPSAPTNALASLDFMETVINVQIIFIRPNYAYDSKSFHFLQIHDPEHSNPDRFL